MKKTSKKKKNKVVAKPTIKQEVKVVDVKEEKDVKKPKKKYYADALIILAIMIVSICLHIPSYKYTISLPMLFDEFRDENGDTYLHDMDSYFYARIVREFADTGIDLQATRSDDKLRGPISEKDNAIDSFAFPAFVSIIWRIVRLFSKNIPFIRFIRFMGPIISSLACIPAYLFVKTLPHASITASDVQFSLAISSMVSCCLLSSASIADAICGSTFFIFSKFIFHILPFITNYIKYK